MFLQLPHQAAAKSAREEGWNAWTRDSSLNFRGSRVAVLVEMICEIVNGATFAPSIDTTNHQRRRGRGEMIPWLDSFGATISSSTDFRLFFLLLLD